MTTDTPSSTAGSSPAGPARATSTFLRDLADQVRAGDPYGRFDRFSDDHLLRPFVIDPTSRAAIPVDCDVEPVVVERVRAFYQAVAVGAEKASGLMTAAALDLSHEGFGRAMVFAGRLLLVVDTLRDLQRFGFSTSEALAAAGDRLVSGAVAVAGRFPEVARDDT